MAAASEAAAAQARPGGNPLLQAHLEVRKPARGPAEHAPGPVGPGCPRGPGRGWSRTGPGPAPFFPESDLQCVEGLVEVVEKGEQFMVPVGPHSQDVQVEIDLGRGLDGGVGVHGQVHSPGGRFEKPGGPSPPTFGARPPGNGRGAGRTPWTGRAASWPLRRAASPPRSPMRTRPGPRRDHCGIGRGHSSQAGPSRKRRLRKDDQGNRSRPGAHDAARPWSGCGRHPSPTFPEDPPPARGAAGAVHVPGVRVSRALWVMKRGRRAMPTSKRKSPSPVRSRSPLRRLEPYCSR